MSSVLINNIAFLVALVAIGQIVITRVLDKPQHRQVLLGALFGSVVLLGMANPVAFATGIIFDGRSIVLTVAGVVGGGVTAAIAAALAAVFRYQLGGNGAPVGIAVILISALLGVSARQWWLRRDRAPRPLDYLALGVVVQLFQLAAFKQLPNQAGSAFIEQAWWVLLFCYPPTTMLLCMMFRNVEQQVIDRAAMQRAQNERIAHELASTKRFHAYFDQSIVGLAITSPEKGWIEVNDSLCATLGFTREELTRMKWSEFTHPEDQKLDRSEFSRMLAGEIDNYALDKRFIHKGGQVVYARIAVSNVRKPDGSTDYLLSIVEDISVRKQAEIELLNEKQFSEDTLNALPGIFYMFDATGRFIRWNRQFREILGYTDTELAAKQGPDFFTGADKLRVGEAMQKVFDEGQADVVAEFQTKDGKTLPYHLTGTLSGIGGKAYLIGVGINISAQRLAQKALETERAHLRTLVSTIPDLIWLKDAEGKYLSCNTEFEKFFGAAERDIVGKTDYEFVSKVLADSFRNHDCAAMAAGQATRNEEFVTYASDLRRVWLETTKMPIRTTDGRVLGVLGISHDITERKAHQKQLEHIAHYDTLTGLPNRALLADRLHQAMAQALRRKTKIAVVYLDLDGFKEVNDSYGHDVGDHLLTALAEKLKRALREGDTLSRLGGDEFVAIFLDLTTVDAAVPMLSRLLSAAGEVVFKGDQALRLSASLGVTFFPQEDAIEADQLLRQADQAMYQAKQMGKNRYNIFDAEHDRTVRTHHEDIEQIKHALKADELILYYQPKVNMRTGAVVGAEALIRWLHPTLGLLPPAAFLPLINDHPLAIQVGEWVLKTALAQIEIWKALGVSLPVSVNIDAIHLENTDFVGDLRHHMEMHPNVSPGDLELEVLETSALNDIAKVSGVILACRDMGVSFALDDFGTGYSSLTYLKRLPASLLKIDQSFVRGMLDDPDDLSILEGVLGLSRAFQRRVIAEGVETLAHGEMLLRLGCELAQGYAIAPPMPAHVLPDWVKSWHPDLCWLNKAPISRDDLPILYASVEHRVWVNQVLRYLEGGVVTPPQMHPDHCRLGHWMKTEAPLLHADQTREISKLEALHTDIHKLASVLIHMSGNGQNEAAVAQVPELLILRDRLLSHLLGMLNKKAD